MYPEAAHLPIRIWGKPAPQGSKIPGVSKAGKGFVREQNSVSQKSWRQDVIVGAREVRVAWQHQTFDGPVWVEIDFWLPRPASVKITTRPYPNVKPDGDKLLRNTLDGLKQAGVYRDDAQVVDFRVRKRYATDDPLGGAGASILVGLVPLPVII